MPYLLIEFLKPSYVAKSNGGKLVDKLDYVHDGLRASYSS